MSLMGVSVRSVAAIALLMAAVVTGGYVAYMSVRGDGTAYYDVSATTLAEVY
jgi:hypothetical protein